MPSRRSEKGTPLLALPYDILKLIMDRIAPDLSLHASPKPLLRFLLTTKQLCKPRFKMYKAVVNPFLQDYHARLCRDVGRMKKRVMRKVALKLRFGERTEMLVGKWSQLQQYDLLLDRFFRSLA